MQTYIKTANLIAQAGAEIGKYNNILGEKLTNAAIKILDAVEIKYFKGYTPIVRQPVEVQNSDSLKFINFIDEARTAIRAAAEERISTSLENMTRDF